LKNTMHVNNHKYIHFIPFTKRFEAAYCSPIWRLLCLDLHTVSYVPPLGRHTMEASAILGIKLIRLGLNQLCERRMVLPTQIGFRSTVSFLW
jgi:hypothetical protein